MKIGRGRCLRVVERWWWEEDMEREGCGRKRGVYDERGFREVVKRGKGRGRHPMGQRGKGLRGCIRGKERGERKGKGDKK